MGKKSEKKKLEKAEKKLKKAEKKARKSAADQHKVSSQERAEMIATAAYFIAERHGFTPGRSTADWQAAEKEIDRVLKGKKKPKKANG